jgi:hypothetical protein
MAIWQFMQRCMLDRVQNPAYRKGQAFMNLLKEFRPDLADAMHSTDLDCSCVDERYDAALTYVRKNW